MMRWATVLHHWRILAGLGSRPWCERQRAAERYVWAKMSRCEIWEVEEGNERKTRGRERGRMFDVTLLFFLVNEVAQAAHLRFY